VKCTSPSLLLSSTDTPRNRLHLVCFKRAIIIADHYLLIKGFDMKGLVRKALIIGGIVLVLMIAGFVIAAIFNVLLSVLYVVLIILAALSIISTIYLIYAVRTLVQAIVTVRNEMKPLVASVQETVGVVKETASTAKETVTVLGSTAKLTSEFGIAPGVRTVSALLAAQQMLRVFAGKGRVKSRYEARRKRQAEAVAQAGGE